MEFGTLTLSFQDEPKRTFARVLQRKYMAKSKIWNTAITSLSKQWSISSPIFSLNFLLIIEKNILWCLFWTRSLTCKAHPAQEPRRLSLEVPHSERVKPVWSFWQLQWIYCLTLASLRKITITPECVLYDIRAVWTSQRWTNAALPLYLWLKISVLYYFSLNQLVFLIEMLLVENKTLLTGCVRLIEKRLTTECFRVNL